MHYVTLVQVIVHFQQAKVILQAAVKATVEARVGASVQLAAAVVHICAESSCQCCAPMVGMLAQEETKGHQEVC